MADKADSHPHSENHHRLIAERRAAVDALPKRSGIARIRRREAGKRAAWTLVGHLRCCHGWKGNSAVTTYDGLVAIHDEAHKNRS